MKTILVHTSVVLGPALFWGVAIGACSRSAMIGAGVFLMVLIFWTVMLGAMHSAAEADKVLFPHE